MKASFRQARILLESTKADYLAANLDHDLIPHIKHIFELEPKPPDIYTQIKMRPIASFSISAETRLRRLLRGEVISDGKPSFLLTSLRALNDGSCTDTIIKNVFLEQMPSHIRAILAMSNVEDLQKLANLADKVSEALQPTIYQIAATSSENVPINFCVTAVPYPILGADLLAHYHLVPFLHESRLVDTTTGLSTCGFLKSVLICGLCVVNRDHAFSNILASFPELTYVSQRVIPLDIDVQHHILTNGPPVFERVRCLSPEKLAMAKAIFQQMVGDGICYPSSSPWATPIDMVKKKNGEWCVSGHFRRLNAIKTPDRYPVPRLHDFSSMLRDKRVFT